MILKINLTVELKRSNDTKKKGPTNPKGFTQSQSINTNVIVKRK